MIEHIKRSLGVALWFMFLTLPLMVIRVNTIKHVVEWRWLNMAWVGLAAFVLALVWRFTLARRRQQQAMQKEEQTARVPLSQKIMEEPRAYRPLVAAILAFSLAFPLVFSTYQTNIMISALIYVTLGLGLNITVGLVGLLELGYVAYYAVGAYTYGLLHAYLGWGFWAALPAGALTGAATGALLGYPVLRLRGDYLAIVTLGFASIIKIILENWSSLTFGPKGVANIPHPGLFGIDMDLAAVTNYIYYLMIALVIIVIFITNRLKNSRIGRAWIALREDEVACVAMGVDMARTKLSAYAFSAGLAGLVGVIFAAKTTYINPNSFTFMESAIMLSIVVLGGMGSIVGVIFAGLMLILLPEYLRAFADYRMLVFGAVMVLMMIFRPQGLIPAVRRKYRYDDELAHEQE